VIAHGLDLSGDPADLVPPLSDKTWSSLGLTSVLIMETLEETQEQFGEASQVLIA
jgi:hypothetical protein